MSAVCEDRTDPKKGTGQRTDPKMGWTYMSMYSRVHALLTLPPISEADCHVQSMGQHQTKTKNQKKTCRSEARPEAVEEKSRV